MTDRAVFWIVTPAALAGLLISGCASQVERQWDVIVDPVTKTQVGVIRTYGDDNLSRSICGRVPVEFGTRASACTVKLGNQWMQFFSRWPDHYEIVHEDAHVLGMKHYPAFIERDVFGHPRVCFLVEQAGGQYRAGDKWCNDGRSEWRDK